MPFALLRVSISPTRLAAAHRRSAPNIASRCHQTPQEGVMTRLDEVCDEERDFKALCVVEPAPPKSATRNCIPGANCAQNACLCARDCMGFRGAAAWPTQYRTLSCNCMGKQDCSYLGSQYVVYRIGRSPGSSIACVSTGHRLAQPDSSIYTVTGRFGLPQKG
eukprot:2357546-Rhodomonas_salina.3